LLITGAILTVRFGIFSGLMSRFHEWKHTYVAESSLSYPDILIHFLNPNGIISYTCYQQLNNANTPTLVLAGPNYNGCPWNSTELGCYRFNMSALKSSGLDDWQYSIFCNFVFPAAPGQNDIFKVHHPGGFVTVPGGWDAEDTPIRPNMNAVVHMEPEFLHPMNGPRLNTWRLHNRYESSTFTGNMNITTPGYPGGTFPASVTFRIPFTVVRAAWESPDSDSWMLMSAWGGGFYFLYCLHSVAFHILKLWLPNDSKLLPGAQREVEYTPLK